MLNAVTLYRAGHACYKHHIPFLPKAFKLVGFLLFNSVIPPEAEIGGGTKCAYGGIGCVVHGKAIIGDRCIIGQNVTIGRSLGPGEAPIIGNDVYISAGARIIGAITIGNNVIIGAGAVVTKDVPSNSIVAGVPAKLLRTIDCSVWDLLRGI